MSKYLNTTPIKKTTIQHLLDAKKKGEKISMLTAYDYTFATIVDATGVEIILVGDSASNVMAGNPTTLPITLDEMIYHVKSVVRGANNALIVGDMPFGCVAGNPLDSLHNAIRMMKEGGANAIKIEGGEEIAEDIKKIIGAGIPVMGHLGLMPQSINKYGNYNTRAKNEEEAKKLIKDALLLQEIGCFAIVLEKIPSDLATEVTQLLSIPTIGIGAGSGTDGQVLVLQDMLGLNKDFRPKFVRHYADLHSIITKSIQAYINDVKSSEFPSINESY